jgi:hypothetical protein
VTTHRTPNDPIPPREPTTTTTVKGRITPVRLFHEDRGHGRSRPHLLAIYDTGQRRVLIDRGQRMTPRLVAVLNDGQEHECVDGPMQIKAICDEYVRQYNRVGGPLACRLSRTHLDCTPSNQPTTVRTGDAARHPELASDAGHSTSRPSSACKDTRPGATTPAEDALGIAA